MFKFKWNQDSPEEDSDNLNDTEQKVEKPKLRGRPPTGRRGFVKTFMTKEELETVAAKANDAGLSLSAYMRESALKHKIVSNLDSKRVLELIKLKADQGRLGGLFKLALTQEPKVHPQEIRDLLNEISLIQKQLKDVIDTCMHDR